MADWALKINHLSLWQMGSVITTRRLYQVHPLPPAEGAQRRDGSTRFVHALVTWTDVGWEEEWDSYLVEDSLGIPPLEAEGPDRVRAHLDRPVLRSKREDGSAEEEEEGGYLGEDSPGISPLEAGGPDRVRAHLDRPVVRSEQEDGWEEKDDGLNRGEGYLFIY